MPSRAGATILVVEDDPAIALSLCGLLERSGYEPVTAFTGGEALRLLREAPCHTPSLVVLDLALPDVDGLILIDQIHALTDTPLFVCTGTPRKRDALLALRLGADDVLTLPFDPEEFCERIAAVLRRSAARPPTARAVPATAPPAARSVGSLTIDPTKREAYLAHRRLRLTPTEYRLLCGFTMRPNQVLNRGDLARLGWGDAAPTVGRALDVHIRRLRSKLGDGGMSDPSDPSIVTVRAIGYKLVCRSDTLVA